jgi:PAS domain S-box-containing protein
MKLAQRIADEQIDLMRHLPWGAFFGGMVLPVVAWMIDCRLHDLPFNSDSIVKIHGLNPLHYLIDTTPFALFGVTYGLTWIIKQQQQRIQEDVGLRESEVRKLSEFARRIGQNQLEQSLDNVGNEQAELAKALEDMRRRLRDSHQRQESENWLTEGRLEVSQLLRKDLSMQEFCYQVLEKLVAHFGVLQGALYVAEQDRRATYLRMAASYAYGRRKYLSSRFVLGEGLVGECGLEKMRIHRTELPDRYTTLSSGLLGNSKPGAILLVPILSEHSLQGVLELASFERFSKLQIRMAEESAALIGGALSQHQHRRHTQRLLEESQRMTQTLEHQQAELNNTAAEMKYKQNELAKAKVQLEAQYEELQNQQQRERAILENASEIIAIFNTDGGLRYISPSVRHILGYQPSYFDGIHSFRMALEEGYQRLSHAFQEVLERPFEMPQVEFQFPNVYGQNLWIEALLTNQLDNPAIEGIVFNMRDITSRKQAQQEEEMRARMESLSENSPSLILRLDLQGRMMYINPAVEYYFGFDRQEWLQHSLADAPLNDPTQALLADIVSSVEDAQEKIEREAALATEEGERLFVAEGIPEYESQTGRLETVLIVIRDITERRRQYVELQEANRKISDSINYARRIQDAIIPDEKQLREWFSDGMVLNMPRDVVSGDFPWFFRRDRYAYVAAADCTGHGVPGAIMSAIGFLLLRNIMRREKTLSPAEILLQLHHGVVEVLQQESTDKNANDGLDIALSRVDLSTGHMLYAGAHRPCLVVPKDGSEVARLKGDRFSIGGTHGRGKTQFSDQGYDLRSGDRFYLFSDGLTDQFNPGKTKFGPKRVRETLLQYKSTPLGEQSNDFRRLLDQWMDGASQLDDILLVGVEV